MGPIEGRSATGRLPAYASRSLLPPLAAGLAIAALAGPVLGHVIPNRADVITAAAGDERSKTWLIEMTSLPAELDVLFVTDLSGSYDDDLPAMRELIPKVGRRLTETASVRFGVASFIDTPRADGASSDYPYLLHQPLSNDLAQLERTLADLRTGHGGDPPETSREAVLRAVADTDFRPDAVRIVLLATDAPSRPDGPSVEQVAQELGERDVRLVAVLPEDSPPPDAAELAAATGGSVQTTDRSSTNLDQALLRGVRALPVDVQPRLSDGCPVTDVTFSPSRVEGAMTGEVPFTLTFRVDDSAAAGNVVCRADFGHTTRDFTLRVKP